MEKLLLITKVDNSLNLTAKRLLFKYFCPLYLKMVTLYIKELQSFLTSLIGYMVITVFLITIGLIMWVFPGNLNVLEIGYANIETLFVVSPWVFMFLAPAITMRSFSEEFRTGTIELLLTRPLTDFQIIFAKFFAGFTLVLFALTPTLVYFYTIWQLAMPTGNIDTGAILGSYLGLAFLSAGFVAIGVFASSITSNQIVAFILGVFISFVFLAGFDALASLKAFGFFDNVLLNLSINQHYISMSRGVLDTRDMVYFVSISAFFMLLTLLRLSSRKW